MKTEISWKSKDGTQIFALEWSPKGKATHCITLIHGLGEHIGRYERFASFYNEKSAVVTALDLRGHGKTSGLRGHVPSWDTFLEDISELKTRNSEKYPGIPQFVYGHSMGGMIALSFALKKNPNISGVIASAPLITTNEPVSPLKLNLAKYMNAILPTLTMDNGLDRNALSKDTQVIEKYNQDPLVHGKISARLGWSLIETGTYLLEQATNFSLPLLVIIGSEEKIVSKADAQNFTESTPRHEFKVWNGLFHELHNEPEWEDVLEYAENWMSKQMVQKSF